MKISRRSDPTLHYFYSAEVKSNILTCYSDRIIISSAALIPKLSLFGQSLLFHKIGSLAVFLHSLNKLWINLIARLIRHRLCIISQKLRFIYTILSQIAGFLFALGEYTITIDCHVISSLFLA